MSQITEHPVKTASLSTKLFFGSGSVAFGIKEAAFSYFLLLYYNQVLGLDAFLCGLALAAAVAADAIMDLGVGYWSDHFVSRWGRRHPFMYAGALPAAVLFYLSWNPPDMVLMDKSLLFAYLLITAVLLRIAVTFFEVPNAAQGPELTYDYDDRTRMQAFRYAFGWLGGLVIATLAFLVLFRLDPQEQLGPIGYQWLGLVGAVAMISVSLVSALGTHRHIKTFYTPTIARAFNFKQMLGHVLSLFRYPSFVAVFVSALLFGAAMGLNQAMNIYVTTFYWQLNSAEIGYIPLLGLIAVPVSFVIAPRLAELWGKKHAALRIYIFAIAFMPVAFVANALGIFPDRESALYLPLIMLHFLIETTSLVSMQIVFGSMNADLVEDRSVDYAGHRDEGLIFAARNFSKKVVSGIGILLAGAVLTLAGFPENADPASVSGDQVNRLVLVFVPCVLLLFLSSWVAMRFYRIDRKQHEHNLNELRKIGESA
ncbi:MAG: MFS transporter [Pseudomonadota bacterium]